eukprot:GHUV01058291.1.p1 GENE.GHUV01058291.1~~GHUV01058291.1.p1  ORF type:complete len:102 (-),score=16.64 GHUV01058291.1:393-698(-)
MKTFAYQGCYPVQCKVLPVQYDVFVAGFPYHTKDSQVLESGMLVACVQVEAAKGKSCLPLLQVLMRRTKHNPVLIGEAGVGKTAIVEGIAQLVAAPQPLRG